VTTTLSPTLVVPQPSSTVSSSPLPLPPVSSSQVTSISPSPLPSSAASFVCSPGFQSCPQSLGGGCCPTDRSCGAVFCGGSTATSTASAVPPVRPTSLQSSSAVITSSPATSGTVSVCPTGFYMCSAVYRGGCCQVGRNCDSTSCPPTANTNVVISNGITIAAPSGAAAAAGTGLHCPTGWYSCGADVGGNCCPNGYNCGTATCQASASGGGSVGKQAPNSMASRGQVICWLWMTMSCVSGFLMLLL
jgi:progranulin